MTDLLSWPVVAAVILCGPVLLVVADLGLAELWEWWHARRTDADGMDD